jgi:hypothetical protein
VAQQADGAAAEHGAANATLSQPGDPLEREAERAADQVTNGAALAAPLPRAGSATAARMVFRAAECTAAGIVSPKQVEEGWAGTIAHAIIQLDFLLRNPTAQFEYQVPYAGKKEGSTGEVDIIEPVTKSMYEIKTENGAAKAVKEISNYVQRAREYCSSPLWHEGDNYWLDWKKVWPRSSYTGPWTKYAPVMQSDDEAWVELWTKLSAAGVIAYQTRTKTKLPDPVTSPKEATDKEKEKSPSPATAPGYATPNPAPPPGMALPKWSDRIILVDPLSLKETQALWAELGNVKREAARAVIDKFHNGSLTEKAAVVALAAIGIAAAAGIVMLGPKWVPV